jgi:predicted nucleic acid-binding protein
MKQRFYLDTSVWGGVFDREFEHETAALFKMVNAGTIVCLYSSITEKELVSAPADVRAFFENLSVDKKEQTPITPEAMLLAEMYVREKVVGKTSFDDCLHIATATVHSADLLVSWNFKHIVNADRINGYNAINIRFGYSALSIKSPKDIAHYENNQGQKSV